MWRTHRRSLLALLLLLQLPLLTGCATLGLGGFNIISVEQEWELGREIEQELAGQLTLSTDAELTGYVRDMGQAIVSRTPLGNREWRFHVVEDDAVNAFNAPGGLVYINTGLIRAAENASELAAVVAHEIGHGVARHGTQRLSQQYGVAVLAGVILGEDPSLLAEIAASLAAAGAMARSSREDEFEADELGIQFMAEGGYHPRGVVTFFERLLEMRQRNPGSVERFFASHPAMEDRIDRAEGIIAGMGSLDHLTVQDGRFPSARSRVE